MEAFLKANPASDKFDPGLIYFTLQPVLQTTMDKSQAFSKVVQDLFNCVSQLETLDKDVYNQCFAKYMKVESDSDSIQICSIQICSKYVMS